MGKFIKNTLITFITRVFTAGAVVGITVIIARTVGPERQGIYSLAILLPTFLLMFGSFGINLASTFYLGKRKYPPKEVFGNNIIIATLVSSLVVLVGLVIIFLFSDSFFLGVNKEYLILALFLVPLYIFFNFISHILLGLQKIKKYNIICFSQSFLFLSLVGALLLGFHWGVKAAILAEILSFIIIGIVLFFFVKKETGGIAFKLNKNYFKDNLSYGLKGYFSGIFYFLHRRVDLLLINFFINPMAVGLYYVAVGLSEAVSFLSASAATVLFPRVSSETNEKNLKEFTPMVCRSILLVTLIMSVLLFILGDWIIPLLYSDNFLGSVRPFRILIIGALLISGWQILANDLSGRGRPMLGTYPIGVATGLNVILNILWIPKLGIEGAAWATVVSCLVMFLITVLIYSRVSGNRIRDTILFKKSDFKFYKSILLVIKNRTKLL